MAWRRPDPARVGLMGALRGHSSSKCWWIACGS